MRYNMFQLANNSACKKRRAFGAPLDTKKGMVYGRSIAIRHWLMEAINGATEEAVLNGLLEDFKEIGFLANQQRRQQAEDACWQIMRYVNSETRKPIMLDPEEIALNEDISVLVSPSVCFVEEPDESLTYATLEIVKYKCSAPTLTQKAAGADKGLFSMLMYGKQLAKKMNRKREAKGQPLIKAIAASYYFLRKNANTESYGVGKKLDSDFFVNNQGKPSGGNIVTIWDDENISDYQKIFKPILEEFIEGIPEEDCTERDCQKCELNDICHFTEPALSLTEDVKQAVPFQKLTLTKEQWDAVNFRSGICRINAGPGAGKTMVIAYRTTVMLDEGVDPASIFLCTFTNAGATEMRERISRYLTEIGHDEEEVREIMDKMHIMTFNAFGDEVLKVHYKELGFEKSPTVIDPVIRNQIIAKLLNNATEKPEFSGLKTLNWRYFDSPVRGNPGALIATRKIFDLLKQTDLRNMDEEEGFKFINQDSTVLLATQKEALPAIYALFDEYEEELRTHNLIEYADQEGLLFELMDKEYGFLDSFGFAHIVVDEFQDSNERQVELIKRFSNCSCFESLLVVGDDSQSIYMFRNTSPEYMINFQKYLGAFEDKNLLTNFRSTKAIVDFANNENNFNVNKVDKVLLAAPNAEQGKPVWTQGFLKAGEEIEKIVEIVKEKLEEGYRLNDVAIIAFTKYELKTIADALAQENIPAIMLNPESLADNSRVKAALALIRAIQNEEDSQDLYVFANAYSESHRGKLLDLSLLEIAEEIKPVAEFIQAFRNTEDDEEQKDMLMDILRKIDQNEEGKTEAEKANGRDEIYQSFLERLDIKSMSEILTYANAFDTFGSEEEARRMRKYPGIQLTTAHSSKGLEWPVVIVSLSKFDDESIRAGMKWLRGRGLLKVEDRRRLFFVAATRAQKELYITSKYDASGNQKDGYLYNQFLREAYSATGKCFDENAIEEERKERRTKKKPANAASSQKKTA